MMPEKNAEGIFNEAVELSDPAQQVPLVSTHRES